MLYDLSPRGFYCRSVAAEKGNTPSEGNLAKEAHRHLVPIDYDRDLRFSFGVDEHFIKFVRIFLHIDVNGPIPVGCTSLIAEGSGIRAVNDDLVAH